MLTDDDLAAFDRDRLVHGEDLDPAKLLDDHGDTYRSHLIVAKWIDDWRSGARNEADPPAFNEGVGWALRQVAAHLRQGDLLPGHTLHDETLRAS